MVNLIPCVTPRFCSQKWKYDGHWQTSTNYIYCICVTLWHTTINFLLGPGPFKTRECSDVIGSLWTLPISWLWFKLASNLSATMQNGVHNDYMLPINVLLAISDSLKCLLSWRTHFLGLDALIITEKVITDHSTYHYLYTIATTTMLLSARVLSHSPRCCNYLLSWKQATEVPTLSPWRVVPFPLKCIAIFWDFYGLL